MCLIFENYTLKVLIVFRFYVLAVLRIFKYVNFRNFK